MLTKYGVKRPFTVFVGVIIAIVVVAIVAVAAIIIARRRIE